MTSRELTSGFDFWSGGASSHKTRCRYLYPVQSYWHWLGSFQVIRIWIFSRSSLKVLFAAPKFQFLGDFTPKFRGTSFRPQKALPWAERRVLSPHWSRSDAQCDLWPWQKNQKKERKKDSGKLAICPDHPRRRTEIKVCMPGVLQCVVLYFKFY